MLFTPWLFKCWIVLSTRVKIYLKVNTVLVSPILIQGVVIYLVELSAIACLNNQDQALVVQKLNSAIKRISIMKTNNYCALLWIVVYPVGSTIHLSKPEHRMYRHFLNLGMQ